MAFICANGTRIATPRSMLNRYQSVSTIQGSVTSRRSSATAGSGGKRHLNAATPRGEKITRHGSVWRTVPSAVASQLSDFLQGEPVVEALLLAVGSVAVWMSIQSRGFGAIASVESCLIVICSRCNCHVTLHQRSERPTHPVVNRSCQSAGSFASERNKRCFARTRVGDTEGSTILEK